MQRKVGRWKIPILTAAGVIIPWQLMQEILQERAALYAAGVMLPAERAEFELLLEFHEELQQHVSRLLAVVATVTLAESGNHRPPAALKDRILAAVPVDAPSASEAAPVARVRTDAAGLIEWVNEEFTAMCGYTLPELRGRKPGALLQGAATDPGAVAVLRDGIRQARPAEVELVNYHKDGGPYRVHVAITPILDDMRKPIFYLAEERKLALAAV
jgi:PAS domain S-box-containing protein